MFIKISNWTNRERRSIILNKDIIVLVIERLLCFLLQKSFKMCA